MPHAPRIIAHSSHCGLSGNVHTPIWSPFPFFSMVTIRPLSMQFCEAGLARPALCVDFVGLWACADELAAATPATGSAMDNVRRIAGAGGIITGCQPRFRELISSLRSVACFDLRIIVQDRIRQPARPASERRGSARNR